MTPGRLTSHVAELPGFLNSILTMDEIDFAKGHYKPLFSKTPEELMNVFQQQLDEVCTNPAKYKPAKASVKIVVWIKQLFYFPAQNSAK